MRRSFEFIYSDLSGPFPQIIVDGFLYFIIFIDDYIRDLWIQILSNKNSETIRDAFEKWLKEIENNSYDHRVSEVRTDDGKEYTDLLIPFLNQSGIRHPESVPYSPQTNDVAE